MKGDLIYDHHGDETPSSGYALCWPGGGATFATLDDLAAWVTADPAERCQETPEQRSNGDIISALFRECLPYLDDEMIRRTGYEFDSDANAKLRDLIKRIRAWIGEEAP